MAITSENPPAKGQRVVLKVAQRSKLVVYRGYTAVGINVRQPERKTHAFGLIPAMTYEYTRQNKISGLFWGT